MQLEDAMSASDTEIYFAAARSSNGRRGEAVSIGDHFWSSLGRQGRCYLLRLDALFIPIHRRPGQPVQAAVSRMASVSVFYPPSYASNDVNYALRLKRVRTEGELGASCVGFHRVFTPPADYELFRHPKPLTMTLKDFFDCIGPNLEKHSPDAWGEQGLELPDFLASSGQRPRRSGKARVLILTASVFNRLQRCSMGHRLFAWSREDALQCMGDNRLFQSPCSTRLFFCRRKHPLYHVNRHTARQEALAPKRKGHMLALSLRTEREACSRFHLHFEPPAPLHASFSQGSRRKSTKASPAATAVMASAALATAAPAAVATAIKRTLTDVVPLHPPLQLKRRGRRKAIVAAAAAVKTAPAGQKWRRRKRANDALAANAGASDTKTGGKKRGRPPAQKRRRLADSPSPPQLSPQQQILKREKFSPVTGTPAKRRWRRMRLHSMAANGNRARLIEATIDSVIATVLDDGSQLTSRNHGSGSGQSAALFQMQLETISPPTSPQCRTTSIEADDVSPPPPPLPPPPPASRPPTSFPQPPLGLNINLQLNRQQYFQQQQLPNHHQQQHYQQQQQQNQQLHQQHLLLSNGTLNPKQQQHQQPQHPDLFRLQHRELQYQHQLQSLLHQQQQQWAAHPQAAPQMTAMPQPPPLCWPPPPPRPLPPPLHSAAWLSQKPQPQLQVQQPQTLQVPQLQQQQHSTSGGFPQAPFLALQQEQQQRLPIPPPAMANQPTLRPSQPSHGSVPTLVPIYITNPVALSAAGLLNLGQLNSIGH